MISRHQQILKLAQQTLTNIERHWLNSALTETANGKRVGHGTDFYRQALNDRGFGIGPRLDNNTYYLTRETKGEDPLIIGNCVLKGDQLKMVIVPRDVTLEPPKEITKEEKKYKIPWDAYNSPAALYERWEREEDEDDE
jgi:hypothetical protein